MNKKDNKTTKDAVEVFARQWWFAIKEQQKNERRAQLNAISQGA